MAEMKCGLVYGGASVGLMGDVANSHIAAGGYSIGVIPRMLLRKEVAHDSLQELRVVESMHERKAMMADLSHAFLAIPGGFGTLDELCEIITWAQLGIHAKPIGILNTRGYFDAFLKFISEAVDHGFIRPGHRDLLIVESDPETILKRLAEQFPCLP